MEITNQNVFEYQVTLIVPIYNMEKFLRGCLESVVNQTIDLDQLEVLLIDDGSPDNSIDICNEFAAKYPCMKILRKENEGLSLTRNYGLKRAKGKYIMYLDADDTLTPKTIKEVANFFDKHYDEVDLVTYGEIPIINGEERKPHYRYNYLVASGVYDLTQTENIYISQTRVNICVKNKFEDNILFDLNRDFRHEDQKYCIQVLQDKMKIGYCEKGTYLYLHQPESIVRSFFYAYYMFEPTMNFWEEIFACYPNEIPKYIQALYMNDISWKTCSDILYPYHYPEKEFQAAVNRILTLLNRIDDDVILCHPGINGFHRHYFINMKNDNQIQTMFGPNELVITNHGVPVFETKKIELVVIRFHVRDGKIKMIGLVKTAAFNYLESKPRTFLIKNRRFDQREELDTMDSSFSYNASKIRTNNFWSFDIEFDYKNVNTFQFQVEVEGVMFDTSFYFMNQSPISVRKRRTQYFKEGKEIAFANNVFTIKKRKKASFKEYISNQNNKYFRLNRKKWAFRQLLRLSPKRFQNVWLYYDCKGVLSDNALFQFQHDIEKKDGVRRYFVVNDPKGPIKKQLSGKGKHRVIRFGSPFHKFIFCKAQKVITAYVEAYNWMPFTVPSFTDYNDLTSDPEIIYLQHGILHVNSPWKYSHDRLGIDKEVVSSYYEIENLKNNYRFEDRHIIPSGMPRYDFMERIPAKVNRILFAPSWRKFLVGRANDEWFSIDSKFLASQFFTATNEFLNSKELEMLLDKYDMDLDFKLHPIMKRYEHLYQVTNKRVHLANDQVDDMDYKVFMTDFSSFVFDFVYLQRPIIYFMPDYDMFLSGMGEYRALDIPLEDAFGDFVQDSKSALSSLTSVLENDCVPAKPYLDKMENFFIHDDKNQRARIYDALMNKEDK